jgi:cytidylate kinase
MNNETIAICAHLGSGSTEVAEIVGKRLGFEVYNTDKLLRRIAIDSNLSFEQLASKSISGEVEIDDVLFSYALDILNKGKVIFEGRSSILVFLAPITLKVFLTAPDYIRAKHVADVRKISYEEAMNEVRISDQDRENLARKMCKVNWQDPQLYDLVVNTGGWKYEDVAELVINAFNMKKKR